MSKHKARRKFVMLDNGKIVIGNGFQCYVVDIEEDGMVKAATYLYKVEMEKFSNIHIITHRMITSPDTPASSKVTIDWILG